MNSQISKVVLRPILAGVSLMTVLVGSTGNLSAQTLTDDFSGSSINATIWRTTLPSGGNTFTGNSTLTVSGGNLTASVTTQTTNQRAFLLSQSSNFNFYLNPTTIDIALGTLAGNTANSTTFADHYVMISNLAGTEKGYVNGSSVTSVYASAASTNGTTVLEVGSIMNSFSLKSASVTYTGTLTNLSLSLNSTGFSLTGTGTGGSLPATVSGLWSSLNNISSSSFNGTYYLSLGASNRGAQTGANTAQFSSINVVPEPATIAFLTIAGMVWLLVVRRRRGLR